MGGNKKDHPVPLLKFICLRFLQEYTSRKLIKAKGFLFLLLFIWEMRLGNCSWILGIAIEMWHVPSLTFVSSSPSGAPSLLEECAPPPT